MTDDAKPGLAPPTPPPPPPPLPLLPPPQFVIPHPFHAWCHLCNRGFMSIAALQQHDRDSINEHQLLNQSQ